ncbi:hypothetical protein [Pelagibacterium lentulum]|uniref:Uncharacterized protein n=1 Tax=Pelagibacterium lentulum TaxID=2029865 RepID=A0A916RBB4_9HYPH|nr:hypothetical protein [Pelagibacterium lentulum]GGA47144.1 hypothetical protein GCM10011499_16140 [Pelagibacterium lentulum]
MHKPLLATAIIFALAVPALAQEADGITSAPMVGASLTEKIWMRSDNPGLPGSMVLFLSEGTMLMDSCWETYRINTWQMIDEDNITWDEDGMAIAAEIVELNEAELILSLHLGEETVEQHFEAAPVPYICPDLPR